MSASASAIGKTGAVVLVVVVSANFLLSPAAAAHSLISRPCKALVSLVEPADSEKIHNPMILSCAVLFVAPFAA